MIPTGYRFLINWGCTLLWLGFWPPVYAVLNLIMNIAARSSTVAEIGTSGGITIANVTGIAAANAEIKVMAGYLALSVPFICIALVKGVCSFIHLASQMTGTTTSSANNAVNEVVNGNLSYGNVNLGNSQMGNVSQLQRNMNSLIGSGGHRLDTGGVQITNDAKGFSVMNRMQDSGPRGIRGVFSRSEAQQEQIRNMNSEQKSMRTVYSNLHSVAENQISQFSERLSKMKAEEISNRVNVSAEEGKSLRESARYVEANNKGKTFNSGTNAQGNVGVGAALSGSFGFTKTKMGEAGTDKAAETLKSLQASASINGGVGTGVNASNTRMYGSQEQIDEAQTYNYHKSRVESAMKSLGTSERNDELTSIARDYNKNIQEMDSLSKAMETNQSKIIQAEKNVQESIHTTISLDDNLLEDFIVGAKKANPEMSDNQAKELFFRGDRDSEGYREAVHYVEAINRPYIPQSKLEKPQIDAERLKFNEENLENTYHEKEQIVQSKIDDTSEMIAQTKREKQAQRENITEAVNDRIAKTDSEITQEKQEVQAKSEAVKQKVKERGNKGALKSAWNEGMSTIFGDDDE